MTGNAVSDRYTKEAEAHSIAGSGLTPSTTPRTLHTVRHTAEGSSNMSLADDHFPQYIHSGGPTTSTQGPLRRNRPSLTRQTEINDLAQVC